MSKFWENLYNNIAEPSDKIGTGVWDNAVVDKQKIRAMGLTYKGRDFADNRIWEDDTGRKYYAIELGSPNSDDETPELAVSNPSKAIGNDKNATLFQSRSYAGQSGTNAKKVVITITSNIVGQYEARSYPHPDQEIDGYENYYMVPVYEVFVGTEGNPQMHRFIGTRFMPYFNDPRHLDPDYKTPGWINCGLSSARKIIVTRYKQDYEVHNREGNSNGAIVLKDTFYIHEGPPSLAEAGWGSAGCVEIFGSFAAFKHAIVEVCEFPDKSLTDDQVILKLVQQRRLIVIIEQAQVPNIKSKFTRKVQ